MPQRGTRILPSTAADLVQDGSEVDEDLIAVGKRLRIRKVPEVIITEEERQDRMLKERGLFEKGMSREQKKEMLSVVAASEVSATIEEKSRRISDKFEYDSVINPELYRFSQNTSESPNGKPQTDDEGLVSPMPVSFDGSCHSYLDVVPESPDKLDVLSSSLERPSEKEKKTENEDTLLPELILDDTVKRRYDRQLIDPLNFIGDTQFMMLIDKRKPLNKVQPYSRSCCPEGMRPRDFAKLLRKNFETYHKDLYAFQRRSLHYLNWGAPVVVGRHCPGTLDLWSLRQSLRQRENSEEAKKELNEIIDSNSEGECDTRVKKDGSPKRKYNFKGRLRAYGRMQEQLEEPKKCPFTFSDSSDDDFGVKKDWVGSTKLLDKFREVEKRCLEATAKDGDDEYIPGHQPAKKKRKPIQLGLIKTKPRVAESNSLAKSSFYGKSTESNSFKESTFYEKIPSQALDLHHVTSEEACPRIGAPKQSTNLQDVIKPNLKVNVNRARIHKKWLCRNGRANQSLGSDDKANGLEDEVEIVDTVLMPAKSKGGDGEVRQKGRVLRKLANVARSVKPIGNGESLLLAPEESLSKRVRLESGLEGEIENSVGQDKAKEATSTYQELDLTIVPEPEEQDVQPEDDDVPCPLCGKKFAPSVIEEHASDCQESQDETSRIPTRTPKNKHRCYICRGVFEPDSYNEHVIVCVARERIIRKCPVVPEETTPTAAAKVPEMEMLLKENYPPSLLSRLDTPKIGASSSAKTFNCISGESPFANTRSLRSASVPFNHIDEGNFSMVHVSTPTFQMFKPISQLKDSQVDFKNQFPVARQGGIRRTAKSVKTKRKRSFKGKKSTRGRKSK